MSLNGGEPGVQGNLLSFFFKRTRAATGKWESFFWISTFPRGRRRGCGNVGIAPWRFPRAVGNDGKPAFGFPRFSIDRHFHSPLRPCLHAVCFRPKVANSF